MFELTGYENDELEIYNKKDGLLDKYTYFYSMLLDAAKRNKNHIKRFMKSIEESYVCDLLHAKDDVKIVNRTIVNGSKNIVISEAKYITDRKR